MPPEQPPAQIPPDSAQIGLAGGLRRAWRDHGRRALGRAAAWLLLQILAALVLVAVAAAALQLLQGAVFVADTAKQIFPKSNTTK
jgi:hypothetical protein